MIKTLLQGLALLRHPELIRDLGERRFHLLQVKQIKARFPTLKISNDIRLIHFENERLGFGEHVSVCEGTIFAFGDDSNGYGKIKVGDRTWIGQYNNFRASGEANIEIGTDCLISQFCTLVGTNHQCAKETPILLQGPATEKRGVTLGNDVWLGASVSIMPGISIGTGAIVGANSVVTKDVLEYEIWAGTPAEKIGERT